MHWVVLEEIAEKEIKVAFYNIDFHDTSKTDQVNPRNKDGSVTEITVLDLVGKTTMGGCHKNDQMCHLHRTRRYYRWPQRLSMKFVMWAIYNSFVIMSHIQPHIFRKSSATFKRFIQKINLALFVHRNCGQRVRQNEVTTRLQNVGLHFPKFRKDASTDHTFCVWNKAPEVQKKLTLE